MSEKFRCGYCGAETENVDHYCVQGRNFIVAENNRLRARDERVKRLVRAARALQAGQCLETMVEFSAALGEFEDVK